MTYVFDTDHMTVLEWQQSAEYERLKENLIRTGVDPVITTVVSYEEQSRGWLAYVARARTELQTVEAYRKLSRHLQTYREIRVLEYDEQAATRFQKLRVLKLRIGTMDLRIAAITLAHDATLLSRNLKDFRQVPGLKVEDWTA
jgi:tRNA(fMet)-specific endonuclease VapC